MSNDAPADKHVFHYNFDGEEIVRPEVVFEGQPIQDTLHNAIENIPLLNGILPIQDVKLRFTLQAGYDDRSGGAALDGNIIEIATSVVKLLSFLDSDDIDPFQKLELSILFDRSLYTFVTNADTSSVVNIYANLVDNPFFDYYFYQFSQPLTENDLNDSSKLKYLNEVILNNIPSSLILDYLANGERTTMIHEYAHLTIKRILKSNQALSEYFPNEEERYLIYGNEEIRNQRQAHEEKYEIAPLDDPGALDRIKRNLKLHKNEKISDWIRELPEPIAIKFITILQARAFEENLVRAFVFNSTRENDEYGPDYTPGYLRRGYFYSDVVPGIAKIKNVLRKITNQVGLESYLEEMFRVFKQEAEDIVSRSRISA